MTFSGERVLMESDTREFTLTTHRVRWESYAGGEQHHVSILLEDLTSSGATYRRRLKLLVLAAATAVGAVAWGLLAGSWIGVLYVLAVPLLLMVFYLRTRVTSVSFSSDTATISIQIVGQAWGRARELIEAVEEAKAARNELLTGQRNGPSQVEHLGEGP